MIDPDLIDSPADFDLSFDFGENVTVTDNPYLDNKQHLHILPSPDYIETLNIPLQKKAISALLRSGRLAEADRMEKCGRIFTLYQEKRSGVVRSVPYYCNHRLCQRCQRRRAGRFWKRLKKAFESMKQPKMLTLTVKNVPQIDRAYFKYLRGCFSKLRRRGCFKSVLGGVYSIETTYNKRRKDWHVHIHALIDSNFMEQKTLAEAWKKITKGSWGVDIRQADPDALKEVLKYECKLVDFVGDPDLVDHYLSAVKDARLFHSFGNVFDFEQHEDTAEKLIEKGYKEEDSLKAVATVLKENPGVKGKKLFGLSLKQVKSDTGESWVFLAKLGLGDYFTEPETGFQWTWEKARLAAFGS